MIDSLLERAIGLGLYADAAAVFIPALGMSVHDVLTEKPDMPDEGPGLEQRLIDAALHEGLIRFADFDPDALGDVGLEVTEFGVEG